MLMIYANEVFLVLKHLKFVLLNTKKEYIYIKIRCQNADVKLISKNFQTLIKIDDL